MRRLLALLCALLPCTCSPRSEAVPAPVPRSAAGLRVVRASGPVHPPWSEEVDISPARVRFRRNGEPGSAVNAGVWELEAGAAAAARLFERLGAVDCAQIREVLPEEAPDGGGSTAYEVRYADGGTCSVWYRDGISYTGAEPLVAAAEEFLAGLALPPAAAARFTLP